MPALPLRTLTRAVLAAVAATTLVVVPALVQAEASDDPRAERDHVREQAADVAAQLDALQADAADVAAALEAVTANVQSKRAQLEDARRAARTALAEAQAARVEEQRLEQVIRDLEDQMADLAVEAYIRPPESNDAAVYDTEDVNDTALREALLGTQSNRQEDVLDQLGAAHDDLTAQRVAAEDAAQEAELLRGQTEDRYVELRAAQDQQRELARQVDQRINQAAAEAAALSERDAELSDQIAEEAAEFASYIQGINLGPVGPAIQSGPVSVADAGNGIIVNVSIVDQVHNMIGAAAADGVTLTGGGYRGLGPADRPAPGPLRVQLLLDLPGPVLVLLPADGHPRYVDARAGPGHRLRQLLLRHVGLQLALGQRGQLRPLQPAVGVLALEHHRRLTAAGTADDLPPRRAVRSGQVERSP